jgi:hypothetical protein
MKFNAALISKKAKYKNYETHRQRFFGNQKEKRDRFGQAFYVFVGYNNSGKTYMSQLM